MKHTVELKFPKLIRKKKPSTPGGEVVEVKTEIPSIEIDLDKLKRQAIKVGVPLAIGVTAYSVGRLSGFKSGVSKVVDGLVVVVND